MRRPRREQRTRSSKISAEGAPRKHVRDTSAALSVGVDKASREINAKRGGTRVQCVHRAQKKQIAQVEVACPPPPLSRVVVRAERQQYFVDPSIVREEQEIPAAIRNSVLSTME